MFKEPLNAYKGAVSLETKGKGKGALSVQVPFPPIAPRPTESNSEAARSSTLPLSSGVERLVYPFPSTLPGNHNPSIPNTADGKLQSDSQAPHYDFDALVNQDLNIWNDPSLSSSQELYHHSNSLFSPSQTAYFNSYQLPAPASDFRPPLAPSSLKTSFPSQDGVASQPPKEPSPKLQEGPKSIEGQYDVNEESGTHPAKLLHSNSWGFVNENFQVVDDDDPWDVSDDDFDMGEDDSNREEVYSETHDQSRDLSMLLALQTRHNNQGQGVRSYTAFIDRPNILATYKPSFRTSPLSDEMTARIYSHFINVIAPGLSLNERHPAHPALFSEGQSVPKSQQHLWTCKCPELSRLLSLPSILNPFGLY